jgi:hypothetical protein
VTYSSRSTPLVRTIVLACAWMHAAVAGPVGLANLHSLAIQADAVVAGNVEQGQQVGRDVSFALSAYRVLKGTVKPSEILSVQWIAPAALNGSRDLKGQKGIFFLQKSEAGPWQLLPAMGGDVVFDLAVLPATNGAIAPDLQYASAASMDEKLLLELAAVVENKDGGAFALDYMAGLDPGGVAALSGVYRRFSQSSSIDLKAYGIAGLLRRGDVQVLSQLLGGCLCRGRGYGE